MIGTFSLVAGANAKKLPKRGEGQPPAIWTFDALKGLDALPDSLLVTVETTLLLTAPGTDEAKLDPDTADVAADFRTVEISNPLRLNFKPDSAAAK